MAILKDQDKLYKTNEDICTHLGDDYAKFHGAIVPPIFQNSLFVKPTPNNGVVTDYVYTRVANPTTEIAEKKIAAMEKAEGALCFSSGMAAITSAILHFVRSDSHVVYVASGYGPTRNFLTKYCGSRLNVSTTAVIGTTLDEIEKAIEPNTKLIYLESPSSGVFRMQDIGAIAKIAKARGIGTVIDNTYATPLYQNPLLHGIDIVVHTASKYMGGHSDIVAGALCANAEIIKSIQHNEREWLGGIMDPHQSWLLTRGLRTFPLRVKQHAENAKIIAKFLENHPKIAKIYYPGSDTYEQKELFDKYMTGMNGLLSFIPKASAEETMNFIYNCKVFQYGVGWGGFESLIINLTVGLTEEEAKNQDCPANLVRIHCGLEDHQTLIEDLSQALDKMKVQE
ncbi:MAG: PLP-dependent transferase [Firmicutes bacterium]|jgi:cystathionine gamma-lyase|nr:PLP-dependent transferase [Bacillota bacterium]